MATSNSNRALSLSLEPELGKRLIDAAALTNSFDMKRDIYETPKQGFIPGIGDNDNVTKEEQTTVEKMKKIMSEA